MTAPVGTDAPRVVGPKEQHAIDTAPFSGLAQHYYALFLRKCDDVDRLHAVIESAPHGGTCWLREDPDEGVLPAHRKCTCWKADAL